ncbi:snare associated Golgi protein-domain-containing protein [Flammula alnicola]|nr:snare associated Golgi protein-domain-containing protein [Flammula alnicola]
MTTAGYPPTQLQLYPGINSTSTLETKVGELSEDARQVSRTPSPTPSEQKELNSGAIDWKTISRPKFWFRREWIWAYVVLVLILVLTALVTLYHTKIVAWLTPVTKWLHGLKFGWLVPIGVLFVISFPPLFGHEIVAILCGLVWGLWIGFGIVAAGTFLGEVGNFYAFKYCFRSRAEKMEKNKMWYACLARSIRDGGFKIALIARLSAIPGHFTTAIFATCGMNIFVFSIAAILSLPKQFITVYLGVILEQSSTGTQDTKSRIISDVVLAVTFLLTILAMWYLFHHMNKAKPLVIYDRRKARQAKLIRGISPYQHGGDVAGEDVFNPNSSDSDIPLTANLNQQWDRRGHAVGYVGDPNLNVHAPKPRLNNAAFLPLNNPRDVEEGGSRGGHGREDSADPVGWDTSRDFQAPNLHNPHSPNARRNKFEPEMEQTPTQATFVNTEWHAGHAVNPEPRSPFDDEASYDPYGGYRAATPPAGQVPGHGHFVQPTDATFATAMTTSTEPHHNDLHRVPNSHDASYSPHPPAGAYAYQPGTPRTTSPKPPSYMTTNAPLR